MRSLFLCFRFPYQISSILDLLKVEKAHTILEFHSQFLVSVFETSRHNKIMNRMFHFMRWKMGRLERRRHPRRVHDLCVVNLRGRTHPVENWSPGGLLVRADERLFAIGETIEFTLKFMLDDTVLDVSHKGVVLRKTPGKIAIENAALSPRVSDLFRCVLEEDQDRAVAMSREQYQ